MGIDKAKLYELMVQVAEVLPAEITDTKVSIYHAILKPYDEAKVKEAFGQAVRTLSWFPKINQVLEILEGGNVKVRAMAATAVLREAVERLGAYESVKFEDSAIGYAVEALGGWPRVCQMTYREWDFAMKDFQILYESVDAQERREELAKTSRVLSGLIASANRGRFPGQERGPVLVSGRAGNLEFKTIKSLPEQTVVDRGDQARVMKLVGKIARGEHEKVD